MTKDEIKEIGNQELIDRLTNNANKFGSIDDEYKELSEEILERLNVNKVFNTLVYKSINDIIYSDPHQWSTRHCQTCKSVTAIIGKPFGCYRKMEEKNNVQ